jgi:protein-disulfide isomerase
MRERGERGALTLLATCAVALALAAPVAAVAQSTAPPGNVLERALESRAKGGDSARVVVFEIADFQCPYCAQFAADVAPALNEKYVDTGRVQWVFVNLPLYSHPLAWHAAEAALCAGVAGDAFWPMHDRLFAEQETWTASDDPQARFAEYAADLGVPADGFRSCTADDEVAAVILQDLGSAVSAGISGTPTFIILKGQEVVDQIVGLRSVEDWSEILDGALQ